jgi:radical SAM superfamily enzyme YgiQ (UPF0313 family)
MLLTLINTNRMLPPIAPIGLDYVAGAGRQAGLDVELLDLCLAEDPEVALRDYFATRRPTLVGLSFRNIDDCFWPGGVWFLPDLATIVRTLRTLTDAPIVLGGVGFSIFASRIVEYVEADFGIRGDGEQALVELVRQWQGSRRWESVDGLVWRDNGQLRVNRPAWPESLAVPTDRALVDNPTYFRRGGQIGLETKRGCNRRCIYCADPLAKGPFLRRRNPAEVAQEVETLLAQGVDVLHLCDSEFNVPGEHAREVCQELIRRGLGERVRWYAYLAVLPFDAELADLMRRAGCVGINFTSDAASPAMLAAYGQPHRREDLQNAVRLCRDRGLAVMTDLLLGGPGETPETAAESIRFFQELDPDCAGAALGIRLYPETAATAMVSAEKCLEPTSGPREVPPLDRGKSSFEDSRLARHPGVHRRYEGPVDLLRPTFYVSPALGERPAKLVRELIGGDPRFFEPADDQPASAASEDPCADYNYNQNQPLVDAIAAGARGAYWDILRRLRGAGR